MCDCRICIWTGRRQQFVEESLELQQVPLDVRSARVRQWEVVRDVACLHEVSAVCALSVFFFVPCDGDLFLHTATNPVSRRQLVGARALSRGAAARAPTHTMFWNRRCGVAATSNMNDDSHQSHDTHPAAISAQYDHRLCLLFAFGVFHQLPNENHNYALSGAPRALVHRSDTEARANLLRVVVSRPSPQALSIACLAGKLGPRWQPTAKQRLLTSHLSATS